MPKWKNYYEILGVSPQASQEEIQKAYRDLARIYHTDRMAGLSESVRKRAEEKMKEINEAYEVLKDPDKRKEYHSEWLREKGATQSEPVRKTTYTGTGADPQSYVGRTGTVSQPSAPSAPAQADPHQKRRFLKRRFLFYDMWEILILLLFAAILFLLISFPLFFSK